MIIEYTTTVTEVKEEDFFFVSNSSLPVNFSYQKENDEYPDWLDD